MKKGRLEKYLKRQEGFDDKINKFRMMQINLVKNDQSEDHIIEEIENEYKLDESVINVIKDLNFLLKKRYSGKYRFGFTSESFKDIDSLRIDRKNYYNLKQKLFEVRDKFEQIKNDLESHKNK